MLNLQRSTIELFIEELMTAYRRNYSILEPQYANIIAWSGWLSLENIGNSDGLYHDVEHTAMVTAAGQSILEGKHLSEGGVAPIDWLHFIIALLCHDIGYVKGVCQNDTDTRVATGIGDATTEIPPGGTGMLLAPYHVDRGKLFVRERFGSNLINSMEEVIDAERIAGYIEMTRFPVPDEKPYQDTKGYGGLLRAADFIGQFGDPDYLRKTPALFYEFEEIDYNQKLGYERPGDLCKGYARFYWNAIYPYIQDALRYLRQTREGKQWIANLYSHVFAVEHAGTV